jgi:cation:H+ antiporter
MNEDISVGAILGAPLMISTLSTALMAAFALKRRGFKGWINPERAGFIRDLDFFILAFLFAAIALYLPLKPFFWRVLLCFFLISLYFIYLWQTFKVSKKLVTEGHGVIPDEPLLLSKLGFKGNNTAIALQLLLGLILLVCGTKGFILGVEGVTKVLNVSALLISLLIIPIATELPEKVNSILWIRKHKDTLAFGNLTGAMVFQGTLLPALGVLLTPWQPNHEVTLSILLALVAAFWLRLTISTKGIRIPFLFINGLLYGLYLYLTLV